MQILPKHIRGPPTMNYSDARKSNEVSFSKVSKKKKKTPPAQVKQDGDAQKAVHHQHAVAVVY